MFYTLKETSDKNFRHLIHIKGYCMLLNILYCNSVNLEKYILIYFVSVRCFLGGDLRLNENGGRAALQTLLVRHHNRVAADLASINAHWGDHTLYEVARAIVGASLQHITYKEFLPSLLGMQVR